MKSVEIKPLALFVFVSLGAGICAMPSDAPIPPAQLRSLLGARGMDVDFLKYTWEVSSYTQSKMQCLKDHGFTHIRLRTDLDINNETFARAADRVINDALDLGVVPVLAKIGDAYKDDPTKEQLEVYLDWWQTAAARYANFSHKLLFDCMVEPGRKIKQDFTLLNKMFEKVFRVIRPTNPTRLLSIAPGGDSCPDDAKNLQVPSEAGDFWYLEWHAFASGPQKKADVTQGCNGWGNSEAEQLFERRVRAALRFLENNKNPNASWYGAVHWQNHDGWPEPHGQLDFVKFIMDTVTTYQVPISWETYHDMWGTSSNCTFLSPATEQVMDLLAKYN